MPAATLPDTRPRPRPRGTLVRRLLAAGLVVVAVVAITLALRTPDPAKVSPPVAALGTPLWSARRVPQPIVDLVGDARLGSALGGAAGGNRVCFDVRQEGSAVPLTTAGTELALVPASTLKLLTATGALDALGSDFRFTTRAVAAAGPGADGRVDRLYLVGGGDPLLATPERIAVLARDPEYAGLAATPLADLADRIVAKGVRSIPGGIAGVDRAYDRTRSLDSWSAGAKAAIGPIGALTVNDGFAGAAGSGGAVADPAVNAAAELGRLLEARGVAVGAPGRAEREPGDARTVAVIRSEPLPAVVTEMLSASDNLTAEMLLRQLGTTDGSGSTQHGVEVLAGKLRALGVDLAGASIVDGSGLSADDALRCATLVDVLDLTRRPAFRAIRNGLSVAGERGTLAPRLRGTPLAGNLRAKTGTLAGVSALAGFVDADRPLTFALLLNGSFGESTAFSLRETMAGIIQGYPGVADPAALVPAPGAPIPPRACPDAEAAC